MGVAACFVAILLAWLQSLIDYTSDALTTDMVEREPLEVRINEERREPVPEIVVENEIARPSPDERSDTREFSEIRDEVESDSVLEPPAEPQRATDWFTIANGVATESVAGYVERQESQALMWRKTHSIMFEPSEELVAKEDEPIISDIRFKQRSRVVGLGINLGSCFFGIPIAGVPVDQRSVGISVVVCSQEPG